MESRLDKQRVATHFGKAAESYDAHAVLQREVAQRALERLDYMNLEPRHVLDLGAGTGCCARALARRYRKARIVECDLAPAMLQVSRRQAPRWFSRHHHVCADAERLPFAAATFELVFSSLAVQWCEDLPATFRGVRRTLADGGLFLFTTLGPDTLQELRTAFASVSDAPRVNRFIDMHDIGDMLGAAGFADPVMEAEHIAVEYDDVVTLLHDLKGLGAANADAARPRGMLGPRQLRQVIAAYEQRRRSGKLPATYEVIYGHAWAVPRREPKMPSEHIVPLSSLRRRP
ncbi:MAG: malonyl-ACP O-methyltransferase BioC [Gammaproteobacteria bacterium]